MDSNINKSGLLFSIEYLLLLAIWMNIHLRYSFRDEKILPAEEVGCCSFIWLHWMTRPMIRAYKHGLNSKDLFTLPTQDQVMEHPFMTSQHQSTVSVQKPKFKLDRIPDAQASGFGTTVKKLRR